MSGPVLRRARPEDAAFLAELAGEAGPFYVVEGPSREKALREAREFLVRLE